MEKQGLLRIKLLEATNLIAADSNGKSDPFVVFSLNGTTARSKTIHKTLNPVWDELFTLPVRDLEKDVLHVQVMDWDRLSKDDPLGDAVIPLSTAHLVREEEFDLWVPLAHVATGRVHLSLMPINCGRRRSDEAAAAAAAEASPSASPSSSPPHALSKKERKQAKKDKRKHEKLLKSIPKAAPPNIVDVVVLEGIGLDGLMRKGAGAVSPYCVVRVGASIYVTSTKRSTASCLWQEDCSFELGGEEEPDENVHITVLSATRGQQSHVLGELTVPLATIRDANDGAPRLYALVPPGGSSSSSTSTSSSSTTTTTTAGAFSAAAMATAAATATATATTTTAGSTGYLRLRLQLNSCKTGMLAHLGAPFCTSLPVRVNVGDLLLFSCSHMGAMVTKVGTASEWDHVAMIVHLDDDGDDDDDEYKHNGGRADEKPFGIFESCPSGVRVAASLSAYVTAYWEAGAKIALRRLTAERSAERLAALAAFVQEMDGKPYEKNLWEMVRGSMALNATEDLSGVFCSELVAASYQRMCLLERGVSSNNFMPAHFARPHLALAPGCSLGALLQFKPKRIKPAKLLLLHHHQPRASAAQQLASA